MYQPSDEILQKYARLLVEFALNSGEGVNKGEVVQVLVPDVAKPMLSPFQEVLLTNGAHMLTRFLPTGLDKTFYELANDEQLTFFPKDYLKSRVDLIDHSIGILAEHDLHELKDINPKKIVKAAESKKKMREWLNDKEYAGEFTWTIALYGTPAMAEEVGLTLEEYWQVIIEACYLDEDDPIARWQDITDQIEEIQTKLNALQIDRLHVEAEGIDLWLTLGEKRRWLGGSGRNIPSFEIFTSPDWRGTEGHILFNQPLYRYGNLVEGIRLEFKDGLIVDATAEKNEALLKQIVGRPDADKVGEFSLTDSRMSRITQFMANTLYDENVGGKQGNTHIAVGMAYKDAYEGDPREVAKKEWEALGFNDSGEHCDMMSTTEREVTAILTDGSQQVIYRDGQFVV